MHIICLEEGQNKTRTYHHTLVRIAKTQNTDNTNAGGDVEQPELSFTNGNSRKYYNYLTVSDKSIFKISAALKEL